MLAIALLLVMAVCGGLFTGVILYSAYQNAQLDQLFSIAQKLWDLPFFS